MRKYANKYLRNAAFGLVVLSFVLCALAVIADVGMWNTPYDTSDSAGRRMGFNDPLSMEHYNILISNFRIREFLKPVYAYVWFLLIMHVVGACRLMQVERLGLPRIRWFFGMQGLLFPIGWLGFFVLPSTVWSIAHGTLDREGIIDVPFITLTAQPIWIATSMAILAASWVAAARPMPADQKHDPKLA